MPRARVVNNNLFAYGSLVVPIVMQTVTGHSFRHAVAHLQGFERFMLVGRVYPGVTEAEGCVTPGRVYFDLDEDAMSRLDYFEADDYVRKTADVRLKDSSVVPASVYVVPNYSADLMTDVEWNEDKFVVQDLEGFLEQTRNSMLDYRAAT